MSSVRALSHTRHTSVMWIRRCTSFLLEPALVFCLSGVTCGSGEAEPPSSSSSSSFFSLAAFLTLRCGLVVGLNHDSSVRVGLVGAALAFAFRGLACASLPMLNHHHPGSKLDCEDKKCMKRADARTCRLARALRCVSLIRVGSFSARSVPHGHRVRAARHHRVARRSPASCLYSRGKRHQPPFLNSVIYGR